MCLWMSWVADESVWKICFSAQAKIVRKYTRTRNVHGAYRSFGVFCLFLRTLSYCSCWCCCCCCWRFLLFFECISSNWTESEVWVAFYLHEIDMRIVHLLFHLSSTVSIWNGNDEIEMKIQNAHTHTHLNWCNLKRKMYEVFTCIFECTHFAINKLKFNLTSARIKVL